MSLGQELKQLGADYEQTNVLILAVLSIVEGKMERADAKLMQELKGWALHELYRLAR